MMSMPPSVSPRRCLRQIAFALVYSLLAASPAMAAAPAPTYWQDIRPILRKNCTACHNKRNIKEPDVSGGLALDSYEAITKGRKQPVIEAGKSQQSLLIKMVTSTDDDKRMPLGATPLSAEAITLLRRWIDSGAKEGSRPDDHADVIATGSSRRTRKLVVELKSGAVPPRGLLGSVAPGKLELALKVGPLAPVAAVAFSSDGKFLAVGSYHLVTIWDLAAARPIMSLSNVLGTVNDLRFSPDGGLLAVAGGQPSAKGDLRIFRVADWKLLATLQGHEDVVFSIAFSPDGKRLASASFDKTVRIWNLSTHKAEHTLTGHSDSVYAVAFSPDGKWLASASKDRSIKISNAQTGKSRLTISGMEQDVLAVAFSADGKNIVSSGFESALYWWDAQSGKRVRVQAGHGVAVHELCFSKDGKLLGSASADRTIRLWDGVSGAALKTLSVGSIVYALAISPNGKLVAGGSFDGFVRLWDAATGRHLLTLVALAGQEGQVEWLAMTPEGYVARSDGLAGASSWRMNGQPVPGAPVWKALQQPEALAKAVRGEKLPAAQFGK